MALLSEPTSVALSLWQQKRKRSYGWPGLAVNQHTQMLGWRHSVIYVSKGLNFTTDIIVTYLDYVWFAF